MVREYKALNIDVTSEAGLVTARSLLESEKGVDKIVISGLVANIQSILPDVVRLQPGLERLELRSGSTAKLEGALENLAENSGLVEVVLYDWNNNNRQIGMPEQVGFSFQNKQRVFTALSKILQNENAGEKLTEYLSDPDKLKIARLCLPVLERIYPDNVEALTSLKNIITSSCVFIPVSADSSRVFDGVVGDKLGVKGLFQGK